MSSFRDTSPVSSGEPVDESYKRIVPNSNIEVPELPAGKNEGARLFFRLSNPDPNSIRHGMKFWLNTGVTRTEGSMISVPFVSANPFQDFIVSGRRGKYVGRSAAEKGCMLSKLADQRHPVVALNTLRKDDKGQFKPNVDPFHTAHIQLVRVIRDAQNNVVMVNGRPKFEILPEAYGFEFRQGWWDQFVNVLDPLPQVEGTSVDDGMTDAAPAAPPKDLKKFMADNKIVDISRVVFYIQKKKRIKNATGDAKKDVDYEISFSDKVFITDADNVAAVDVLDWNKIYKVPTTDELNGLISKAENRERSGGASVQAPATAAPAQGRPSADDPNAYFAQGAQVPMDSAAPRPVTPATGAPVPAAAAPSGDPF